MPSKAAAGSARSLTLRVLAALALTSAPVDGWALLPLSSRRSVVTATSLSAKGESAATFPATTDAGETGAADAAEGGDGTEKTRKKKKSPAKRRRRKSAEPTHWSDESDPFVLVSGGGEVHARGIQDAEGGGGGPPASRDVDPRRKSIRFTVRGNPRVLVRHRTGRGFVYNPSRAAQDSFRDCLLGMLPREYRPTIVDSDDCEDDDVASPSVLFDAHEFLSMRVSFRMKRPKSHFVGNRPGPGRLRPAAPGKLALVRSDVDNLAKFVMDSLNGLVYVDDRQVVRLDAVRVLDGEGSCRGATEVEVRALREEDFP